MATKLWKRLCLGIILFLAACQPGVGQPTVSPTPAALTVTVAPSATLTGTPSLSVTSIAVESATPTKTPTPAPTTIPTITPTSQAAAECPFYALSAGLLIAKTQLSNQEDQCLLTIAPVKTSFASSVLPGFVLAYPRAWQLSIMGDFGENIIFEDETGDWSFDVHMTHINTRLPLDQIEAIDQPYEFVSLPARLGYLPSLDRREITLGRRKAVLLAAQDSQQTFHQYFLPFDTTSDGQSTVLVFDTSTWVRHEAEFTSLLNTLEWMTATLQPARADAAVVILPAPALPKASVQAPAGVLVDYPPKGGKFTVYSPDGKPLGVIPGLTFASEVHVISPWTGDANQLQILGGDFIPSQNETVSIYQGGKLIQDIRASWVAWANGAPGQPVIAYTTISQRGINDVSFYIGNPEAFPLPAAIHQDYPYLDSGFLYPYAFDVPQGQPTGVWVTNRLYGIGDFAFNIDFGLAYYDLRQQAFHPVLPSVATILGLSPDQTHVSYYVANSGLLVLDLATKSMTHLDVDPTSSDGPGSARFSPDNRYLAWMEASGNPNDPNTGGSTLHSRLKVEGLQAENSGKTLVDLVDAAFTALVGFTPDWVAPVGWLDQNTVLVQVFSAQDDGALVTLNVDDGRLKLLAPGRFADFVYSQETQ